MPIMDVVFVGPVKQPLQRNRSLVFSTKSSRSSQRRLRIFESCLGAEHLLAASSQSTPLFSPPLSSVRPELEPPLFLASGFEHGRPAAEIAMGRDEDVPVVTFEVPALLNPAIRKHLPQRGEVGVPTEEAVRQHLGQ